MRETIDVTDELLIKEFVKAAKDYSDDCRSTVLQMKEIETETRDIIKAGMNMPNHGGDLSKWSPTLAELLATKLTALASYHEEQSARLKRQAGSLNKLNEVVVKLSIEAKEVSDGES